MLVWEKLSTMKDFFTEIYLNASKKKVWEAFVEPHQFFEAFYGANIQSSFQLGDRLEFSGVHEGKSVVHIYGKVLEYEEGSLLAYTDHPGPMYHEDHAKLESRVRVSFEEVGAGTRLRLINDQFSPNNPMQAEAQQWYLILSNLKTWVETGTLMNLEQK